MTKPCTAPDPNRVDRSGWITLPEFEPALGAPFKVVLIEAVKQRVDDDGEVLETCIPNLNGLLKEIALARALCVRKFSAPDITFVRKAIGLKANELARLLGVSAEHLSRCEHGDRALSIAAEKLLRVIVLKRRYDFAELLERFGKYMEQSRSLEDQQRIRDLWSKFSSCLNDLESAIFEYRIEPVHRAGEDLTFQFRLEAHCESFLEDEHEEEDWKQAA
jgi:DNA-binding transcriptional regulator YiaG